MGRWPTGVTTTDASKRIELSYLLKHKFIVKGSKRTAVLSWTLRGEPSGKINIQTSYFGEGDDFIRLYYTVTIDNVATNYDYKISLIEKDSNLGKGKVLYFQCNYTLNLCRILYMAYNSLFFKSLKAYNNRIYYPNQIVCKNWRHNSRYFELEKKIEVKKKQQRLTYMYNGKVTKRYIQDQRLYGLYLNLDRKRLQFLVNDLKKFGINIDT